MNIVLDTHAVHWHTRQGKKRRYSNHCSKGKLTVNDMNRLVLFLLALMILPTSVAYAGYGHNNRQLPGAKEVFNKIATVRKLPNYGLTAKKQFGDQQSTRQLFAGEDWAAWIRLGRYRNRFQASKAVADVARAEKVQFEKADLGIATEYTHRPKRKYGNGNHFIMLSSGLWTIRVRIEYWKGTTHGQASQVAVQFAKTLLSNLHQQGLGNEGLSVNDYPGMTTQGAPHGGGLVSGNPNTDQDDYNEKAYRALVGDEVPPKRDKPAYQPGGGIPAGPTVKIRMRRKGTGFRILER